MLMRFVVRHLGFEAQKSLIEQVGQHTTQAAHLYDIIERHDAVRYLALRKHFNRLQV